MPPSCSFSRTKDRSCPCVILRLMHEAVRTLPDVPQASHRGRIAVLYRVFRGTFSAGLLYRGLILDQMPKRTSRVYKVADLIPCIYRSLSCRQSPRHSQVSSGRCSTYLTLVHFPVATRPQILQINRFLAIQWTIRPLTAYKMVLSQSFINHV